MHVELMASWETKENDSQASFQKLSNRVSCSTENDGKTVNVGLHLGRFEDDLIIGFGSHYH